MAEWVAAELELLWRGTRACRSGGACASESGGGCRPPRRLDLERVGGRVAVLTDIGGSRRVAGGAVLTVEEPSH
jgi:hypothetical protein